MSVKGMLWSLPCAVFVKSKVSNSDTDGGREIYLSSMLLLARRIDNGQKA